MVRWKGDLYPGSHEPLISKELFDQVQNRLHGKSSPLTKRSFPYRGLMTCGYCGCSITASLIKGRYRYYHCTRGRGHCNQDYIREDRIGRLFLPVVEQVYVSESLTGALLDGIRSEGERRRREAKVRKRVIERQLRELAELRDRAYEDKLKGTVSEQRWLELEQRWAEREDQLKNQIVSLEERAGPAEDEARATFELLQRAPELYQRQSHTERARLLKTLLSNSLVVSGKIVPIYKNPST